MSGLHVGKYGGGLDAQDTIVLQNIVQAFQYLLAAGLLV